MITVINLKCIIIKEKSVKMTSTLILQPKVLGIKKNKCKITIETIVGMITNMKPELRIITNLYLNINMTPNMKKVNFLTINHSPPESILSVKDTKDHRTGQEHIKLKKSHILISLWWSKYTLFRGKRKGLA